MDKRVRFLTSGARPFGETMAVTLERVAYLMVNAADAIKAADATIEDTEPYIVEMMANLAQVKYLTGFIGESCEDYRAEHARVLAHGEHAVSKERVKVATAAIAQRGRELAEHARAHLAEDTIFIQREAKHGRSNEQGTVE